MKNKIEMQYVNQYGDDVKPDAPDVAFQINPGDADSRKFIDALKENKKPADYAEKLEAEQDRKRAEKESNEKAVRVGKIVA